LEAGADGGVADAEEGAGAGEFRGAKLHRAEKMEKFEADWGRGFKGCQHRDRELGVERTWARWRVFELERTELARRRRACGAWRNEKVSRNF
jgi:hypothetical protein